MKRTVILISILLISKLVCAQEIDGILEKHFESWGQEQLLSIRSVQMNITEVTGVFNRHSYQITRKRPGKVRIDEEWQGKTVVLAHDGKKFWGKVPWHKSDSNYELSREEKLRLDEALGMDSPLYLHKKDSLSMEYLGDYESDGGMYHVIRIEKGNRYLDYFIDIESYEIFKLIDRDQGNTKYIFKEVFFKGYNEQSGINLPAEYEIRSHGKTSNIIIDQLTLGHGVANDFFSKISE